MTGIFTPAYSVSKRTGSDGPENTRDQLGLAGFLWSHELVAELIAQRYGLLLARTTVGGYLRGVGVQPQRPQRRVLEQDPVAVGRWLAEKFPAIRARANGRAGWCCGWMRLGPVGCGGGAVVGAGGPDRQALSGQHDQRHLQCRNASACSPDPSLGRSSSTSWGVAPRLRRTKGPPDRGRPSRAPSQAGQRLDWTPRRPARLHFLPGYSPELNPVELLNHDVKANAAGRRHPRSAGELRDELHGYLRQPQVLVRFFDHPATQGSGVPAIRPDCPVAAHGS
jgi:transposase